MFLRTSRAAARGFSLVELSVSLIIIGLLVAGVTAGTQLITNMRIQKTVKEIGVLKKAIDDFIEVRNYYPGDYPNASQEWTAVDGDGDWAITSAESSHVMHHLYNAELIDNSYKAGGGLEAGKNLKETPLKPASYWFHTHTAAIHGRTGEAIDLASVKDGSSVTNGALSPRNAYLLDQKLDDGAAVTGDFTVSDGDNAGSTPCIVSDTPDFALETPICRAHVWVTE